MNIMKKKMMGININYEFSDIGVDTTIVLLHGWGQNIQMMNPIGERYQKYFNILNIDLPGFGESDEPLDSWTVVQYADCVKKLVDNLKIKKVILIGHSFGGRVSLVYAAKYKTEKLVCLAAPYCKEIKKLPLKNRIYKRIKTIPGLSWLARIMRNKIGSSDYKNASEVMKGVLVKAVNGDLTEYAKKIKCPTLLVWGSCDTAVPVNRAYELEKLIGDAGVVVYEGATHYAYLERLNPLTAVLDSFFKVRR